MNGGAEAFLRDRTQAIDAALESAVRAWDGTPSKLIEAIRYSLFAGGKRLRPALTLGAAELVCGSGEPAFPAACAVEMIHTYSLIHDDLPGMDDDDLRRGKPTLHKVYGEALAILAGDALLTMAFDTAAAAGNTEVIREIAHASGVSGMVGGQALDLESEGTPLTLAAIENIHRRKTGALIRASVRCGALLANADPEELAGLTAFGEHLGLAFQIADDILDVTGDTETLGKPAGSDAGRNKSTYPSVAGLDAAKVLAEEEAGRAIESLASFGPAGDSFRVLARYVVERKR